MMSTCQRHLTVFCPPAINTTSNTTYQRGTSLVQTTLVRYKKTKKQKSDHTTRIQKYKKSYKKYDQREVPGVRATENNKERESKSPKNKRRDARIRKTPMN